MKWFTSDLHFYHEKIIQYCDRPFKNANAMNKCLISAWNDSVAENDDVYILGDLAMMGNDKWSQLASVTKKLNGRKHLIYGNHDRLSPENYVEKCGLSSVHYPYLQLENGWILVHDPALATACPKDSVVLAGHVHNLHPLLISIKDRLVFNVGVDVNNYKPVSESKIQQLINEFGGKTYQD